MLPLKTVFCFGAFGVLFVFKDYENKIPITAIVSFWCCFGSVYMELQDNRPNHMNTVGLGLEITARLQYL